MYEKPTGIQSRFLKLCRSALKTKPCLAIAKIQRHRRQSSPGLRVHILLVVTQELDEKANVSRSYTHIMLLRIAALDV